MASISGTVVEVEVTHYGLTADDGATIEISGAQITVQPATGRKEKLNLWTDEDGLIPDRVTQSMWLSMCRDAVTHGNQVLIVTSTENSARVNQVSLRPPA
jgi:hypothetical protein